MTPIVPALPAALAGFLFLTTYVPTDTPVDPRLLAIVSSLQQVLTLGLVVVALRHGLAEAETPLGVRSLQITVNKYLKAIGLS